LLSLSPLSHRLSNPLTSTKRSLMPLPSTDSQDTRTSLTAEMPPHAPQTHGSAQETGSTASGTEPENQPEQSASYVKLAMRNMVKKGRKSLTHFFLTTTALIGLLVGLSYLTR